VAVCNKFYRFITIYPAGRVVRFCGQLASPPDGKRAARSMGARRTSAPGGVLLKQQELHRA
jgi:hypothetical protein